MSKKRNLESLKNNMQLFHEIKIKGGLDQDGNRWTYGTKGQPTVDYVSQTCTYDYWTTDNFCETKTAP